MDVQYGEVGRQFGAAKKLGGASTISPQWKIAEAIALLNVGGVSRKKYKNSET